MFDMSNHRGMACMILAAGLVAGCGNAGGDKNDEEPAVIEEVANPNRLPCESPTVVIRDEQLVLDTEFRSGEGELVVRYSVTNRRANDVYLTTHISMSGSPVRAEGYGVMPRSDGVVEVGKRHYAQPDECPIRFFVAPTPPSLTRVAPGANFSQEFRVPKPLRVDYTFAVGDGTDVAPMPAAPYPVVFCLGVVPPAVPDPRLAPDSTDPVYDSTDFLLDEQRNLCSEKFVI